MSKAKKEKPRKIAYVVAGRSLLTKIGCANAGAKVTPAMIAAGTPESQLTIWYRLIREDGVLELPKTLKTELKNAAKTNKQITLEDFFSAPPTAATDSEKSETSPDDLDESEELEDSEKIEEPEESKSKRKRGAQRK